MRSGLLRGRRGSNVPCLRAAVAALVEQLESRRLLTNQPPVLGEIADQVVVEGTQLRFTALACDPDGPGGGTPIFATQSHLSVGAMPGEVALADLNGDGNLDVLANNSESYKSSPPGTGSLSVLLGHGDGTFAPAGAFALGDRPIGGLVVGDLNKDGKVDVVACNTDSNDVSVLLGRGDGTFNPQTRYAVGADPEGVALGDVNGDGLLDIVTGNTWSNDISLLLNQGNGIFAPQVRFAAGNGPWVPKLADLNGDGNLDLVVPNGNSSDVSVFLGRGDGTFQPQVRYPAAGHATTLAIGDIDGNGTLDVVVGNDSGDYMTFLLGRGDGTFTSNTAAAHGNQSHQINLRDLNGDGNVDIVGLSMNGGGTGRCVLHGRARGRQFRHVFGAGHRLSVSGRFGPGRSQRRWVNRLGSGQLGVQ